MRAVVGGIMVAGLAAGCATPNPNYCDTHSPCVDPAKPYCDLDGVVAGKAQTCIHVTCGPGDSLACNAGEALVCNSRGDGVDTMVCANGCAGHACAGCVPGTSRCGADGNVLSCGTDGTESVGETCHAGCTADPAPHCSYIQPRYLPDLCDQRASGSLAMTQDVMTTDTTTCNGGTIVQVSDTPVCVLRYATISIASGVTVRVAPATVDSGPVPALALVADDLLDISGTLDASASLGLSGAGAGTVASGSPTLVSYSPNPTQAGGGAGGATRGSNGCGVSVGGDPVSNPQSLAVLRGGAFNPGGGGGGGAVSLIACRGTVSITGTVAVNGGGGPGADVVRPNMLTPVGGGGGGGAGGVVIVEGLGISITGKVFANGGGGGSGPECTSATACSADGSPGSDGRAQVIVAAGGFSSSTMGGSGGIANVPPAKAVCDTSVQTRSLAGGGGSVGFVQSFVPAGVTAAIAPSEASPVPDAQGMASVR